MTDHFNKLTPAQAERLAYLSEELGEAIQAIGKVLRHGYDSFNPDALHEGSNRSQLHKELIDVAGAILRMESAGDFGNASAIFCAAAPTKGARYMHHQS